MAMCDYGVIVIKNGKIINENQFFMDMQESVGWVDSPRIKYDDCDCVEYGRSNCNGCPRAQTEHHSDPELGEWDHTVGDCRGNAISYRDNIDGNYFAYVGDENFTVCIYKTSATFLLNKEMALHTYGCVYDGIRCRRSSKIKVGNVVIRIKYISHSQFLMQFSYKGDNYNIIYGYGIDSCKLTWDNVKVSYMGKKLANKIDKIIAKYKEED